jgi:hypothetical protein
MIDGQAIWAPSLSDDRSGSTITTQARDTAAICSTLDNQPSAIGQSYGALCSVQISGKNHLLLRSA